MFFFYQLFIYLVDSLATTFNWLWISIAIEFSFFGLSNYQIVVSHCNCSVNFLVLADKLLHSWWVIDNFVLFSTDTQFLESFTRSQLLENLELFIILKQLETFRLSFYLTYTILRFIFPCLMYFIDGSWPTAFHQIIYQWVPSIMFHKIKFLPYLTNDLSYENEK